MPEKERQVNIKPEHTEERGASHTPYFLDLGTFEEPGEGAYKNSETGKENNPFKWKVIEEYDNFEDAYKGYLDYSRKQLGYDREDLEKIWANGRVDIRLRHGPKMLNWNGIFSRAVDPDEEESKIIKGKDPIERQEEESKGKKDSLSVNDSMDAFIKVFMMDSLNIDGLKTLITEQLKNEIYNSNIETNISNPKIRNLYSREFVSMRGSSVVIVGGLKMDAGRIKRYANKAFGDLNNYAGMKNYSGYSLSLEIDSVEESLALGDNSKFVIKFTIDGQQVDNIQRSEAKISPESNKYTDRIHEVDQVKKEAFDLFAKYYGRFKEQARSELTKGVDLFNQAYDLYNNKNGRDGRIEEYNKLLDDAEAIFMRVAIVCGSTVEGYGVNEINTRYNSAEELDKKRAAQYARKVRTAVNKENREMQKQAKEHIAEEINSDKWRKGLMTNYETPKPKENERSWNLFPAPAPDQRYRYYKKK